MTTDTAHRVTGWNVAAERLFGFSRSTMIGASFLEVLAREFRSGTDTEVKAALDRGETWTGGVITRDAAGEALELRVTVAPIGRPGAPEGYVLVVKDITAEVHAERAAETAEARFVGFMASAPAVAFIKDRAGRYVFANEHLLRLTGDRMGPAWRGKTDYDLWPLALAAQIRENDRLTLAGTVPLEFTQIVPLDDGPHTLLMRKFSLRSTTGEPLLGGIGLDITDRLRAEAEAERGHEREVYAALLARERAIVAAALGHLRTTGTVEAIASSIARQILGLPGFGAAAIFVFELDGRATPVGLALATGRIIEPRPLPLPRSRALRRRARSGAWVEASRPSAADALNDLAQALEVSAMGYAPIRSGDHLVGVLAVGAVGASGEITLTERLPAMVEFAGLAGALLGSSVAARLDNREARRTVRAVIDQEGMQPVFQPIVELAGRTTVGYEALTRFRDGVAPEVRFAAAAAIGLGAELELASLTVALRAAARLPPGLWLNLNVSPALVLAGDALRALLGSHDRPIVCEVTEHAAIEDYGAFRVAAASLAGVRMAVDDAGAGFASLRHILELRPAFVKLDRSLVAGVDSDPVRRALIVGMRHFAQSADCRLIAEGIETEAELAALVELGVPLGQGYLLGLPAPAGRRMSRARSGLQGPRPRAASAHPGEPGPAPGEQAA